MTRAQHALAPGVIDIRLNGNPDDIRTALDIILTAFTMNGDQIIKQSGPYPNRSGPGVRAYTTIRLSGDTIVATSAEVQPRRASLADTADQIRELDEQP